MPQPKCAHPGGVAVCILLVLLLCFSLPVVVDMSEGSRPRVLVFHLWIIEDNCFPLLRKTVIKKRWNLLPTLNGAVFVGLLQAARPSTAKNKAIVRSFYLLFTTIIFVPCLTDENRNRPAISILKLRESDMLETCCLCNLSWIMLSWHLKCFVIS